PPVPRVDGLSLRHARPMPVAAVQTVAVAGTVVAEAADAGPSEEAQGGSLARDYGCVARHAADTRRLVGRGWGGLYGADVPLADGSTVQADDAYLVESIRAPDAQVVAGFTAGSMVSYAEILDAE